MADSLAQLFEYVDNNKKKYIDGLRTWVEIESVSAEPARRPFVFQMMEQCKKQLEELGSKVELAENPLNRGKKEGDLMLPSIILGELGADPKKKTLLVYGHLDVQPANMSDGWSYEPFKLTETDDGKLYGRGSTDDKGPVLGWINVLSAYQALKMDIPVNLKFCFEGMEESGSEGLDELIEERKSTFFSNVDYCCISDNYWLGKKTPCITYGLRGICYYHIKMRCAAADLHSGVFGGTVHEAMIDLIHLFSKIVDQRGRILIPGVNELVDKLTPEEDALYDPIDFDPEEYRKDIGAERLLHHGEDVKKKSLQHRWRYPSLSIHGFQNAFDGVGCKTVIPKEVIGKFSIRLVPSQTPDKIDALVKDYLEKLHKESGSANVLTVISEHGGKPWLSDYSDNNFTSGRKAMKRVFGKEPDLTREGGSIPVTLSLQNATEKSVMLLPIGSSDDGAHSQNEKINVFNYINGIKVLGAYIDELGKLN